MKIVAPLSKIEELDPLIEAGADEFYCSVVPADWMEKFGSSAVSRRLFSSLSSEADLEQAIERIQRYGKHISLVMNAQHYTSEQMDCMLHLAERFAAKGGNAIIVGDPVLLGMIGQEQLGVGLHLSSIAACRNKHNAEFYAELGATRIIFPRDMTLKEMERLSKAKPHLEFEAFMLNDGCVFEEGVCHSIHLPGQHGGAICLDNYQYQYQRIDGQRLQPQEQVLLERNDQLYQQWLWYRFGCGFSVSENGYPFGPCGLCALPQLRDQGVVAVKIAGRDAPLDRKIKSVELVRKVMDQMDGGQTDRAVIEYAQQIRQNPSLCSHGKMCYYPETARRNPPKTERVNVDDSLIFKA